MVNVKKEKRKKIKKVTNPQTIIAKSIITEKEKKKILEKSSSEKNKIK